MNLKRACHGCISLVNVFLAWLVVFGLGFGCFFVCCFGFLLENDMTSVGSHEGAILAPVGRDSDDFSGWSSCLAKESHLFGGFAGFGVGVLGWGSRSQNLFGRLRWVS